jgi:Tfp pilus assembly protein PilE
MRPRIRINDESGSMLIELLIAMMVLTIAVGAILAGYASGYLSLSFASTAGNALTLADKQIELYNTLPNSSVALDSSTIPTGSDPYVTAYASDSTIPSSTGEVTGATAASGSCTSPTTPQPACAVQTVTGPDGRDYRVDTYIVSTNPNSGYTTRTLKAVTVVVRTVTNGVVSSSIAARASSAYDPCNPPSTTTTSC